MARHFARRLGRFGFGSVRLFAVRFGSVRLAAMRFGSVRYPAFLRFDFVRCRAVGLARITDSEKPKVLLQREKLRVRIGRATGFEAPWVFPADLWRAVRQQKFELSVLFHN
ncbi:MAG TPA: hypothetical protein VH684_10635 [Xanthobacteraceae bacterium]